MLTALAGVAAAQEVPELNAQTFRPSVDGARTLWADDAGTRDARALGARVLLQYVDDPLLYRVGEDDVTRVVGSVLEADLLGAVGAGPARVGVVVPVYLSATSDVIGGEAGLGDLAADGRLTLAEGALGLALGGRASFPTASVDGALGSPAVGWELSGIASSEVGPVLLAVNVGTRGGPRADLENIVVDDFFVARGAAALALGADAGAAIELAWQAPYAAPIGNPAGAPLEAIASGFAYTGRDVVVRAGLGRGVTRGIGSPAARILLGVGYEPRAAEAPADTDLDGLADRGDACPREPEDADAFADGDGCPEPDNDGDGIVDAADACPDVAEDADGWSDDDGCVEPTLVRVSAIDAATREPLATARVALTCGEAVASATSPVEVEVPAGLCTIAVTAHGYARAGLDSTVEDGPPVDLVLELARLAEATVTLTRERIALSDSIQFETGLAVLKPSSSPLLEEAARILTDYPEIRRLRVEGHTDERGSAASNLALSEARAKAVVDWFVAHGIEAGRLSSAGLGEERPLDPGHTEEAWTKNRRTDFFVEVWEDGSP